MDLSIEGKVADVLEEQSGESRNGPWRRRDFILEVEDRFPRKICISQWGDSIDSDAIEAGETVKVYFNLQSREYNGRWYTDVRAWRIEKGSGGASAGSHYPDSQEGEGLPAGSGTRSGQPPAGDSRSGASPANRTSGDAPAKDGNGFGDDLNLDDVDDDLPF